MFLWFFLGMVYFMLVVVLDFNNIESYFLEEIFVNFIISIQEVKIYEGLILLQNCFNLFDEVIMIGVMVEFFIDYNIVFI